MVRGPARARRLPVVVLAVVAAAVVGCTGGDPAPAGAVACPDGRTVTPPEGPGTLPARTLSRLGEDDTVATACWLGKPTVVNFWAEWCEPCKEEMPAFEAVHRAVGDQVRFVGVDYEDRADAALAFAEEIGVSYPLVEDPDGSFFDAVQGRGTPHTLLVDAEGTIVHRHAGPLTQQALEDLLAEEFGVDA